MAQFPSGFTVKPTAIVGTDQFLVSSGGVGYQVTADDIATFVGGAGAYLASWNGTDLTQFDAAITSGFTNPALAVVTSGSSKTLQFDADAATAGAYYLRWFTAPVAMQSMTWEMFRAFTVTLGDDIRAGVAVAGVNGTVGVSLYAITHVAGIEPGGTYEMSVSYAQGAAAPAGQVLHNGGGFGDLRGDMSWSKVAATDPAFIFRGATLSLSDTPPYYESIAVPGLGLPALDASWAGTSPNRIGIYITSVGGATNTVTVDMTDIRFKAR